MEQHDLKRLTGLVTQLTVAFHLHSLHMNLLSATEFGREVFLVTGPEQAQISHASVTKADLDTFLSHGSSKSSLRLCAPLIAQVLGDLDNLMRVVESHVLGVIPAKVVRVCCNVEGNVWDVACVHSMFKVFKPGCAPHTEMYMDPTAAQYGEQPGLRRVLSYPIDHRDPNASLGWNELLGHEFVSHLHLVQQACRPFQPDHQRTRLDIFRNEAFIRTSYNVVFEMLLKDKGSSRMLWMDNVSWQKLVDAIVLCVHRGLREIQQQLDDLHTQLEGKELEEGYKVVVAGCGGEGYDQGVEALSQTRNQRLHHLLHL